VAVFELAIGLLLVAPLLSLWADRIGVPYPALLACRVALGFGLMDFASTRTRRFLIGITQRSCRAKLPARTDPQSVCHQ
jgi:hypothetical protein